MASVAFDFVPPDYLPLRRAVARVGSSIFVEEWIASESFLDEEEDRLCKMFDLSRSIAIVESEGARDSNLNELVTELGARTRSELDSDFDAMIRMLREIEYIRQTHGKTYQEIQDLTLGQRLAFGSSTPDCLNEMLAWDEAQTRHILFDGPDPGPRPEHPLPVWPKLRAQDYDNLRRRFEEDHRSEIGAWVRMERVVGYLRNWLYSERIPACVLEPDGRRIQIGPNLWATGIIPDLVFQVGQIYCVVGVDGEFSLSQEQPISRRSRIPAVVPRKVFLLDSAFEACLRQLQISFGQNEGADSQTNVVASGAASAILRGTAGGEKRCQTWLESMMRQGLPVKPKHKYRAEAQEKFAVSSRGFDRAWANAINSTKNEDWRKPGPKS